LVGALEKATGCKFEILQVKEKFGGLRIHVNHANDAIRGRIEAAKQESLNICEVCGQPENGGKMIGVELAATITSVHAEPKTESRLCGPR